MPDYGCCDLGSINLTQFVKNPFTANAEFDFGGLSKVTRVGVRALDNVLDLTVWPLPQQEAEAQGKRRIGIGFTGMGDALIMLGLKYDTEDARVMASKIAEIMRDEAYSASVELAQERGAFPLFDADKYLAEPHFASRLPSSIKKAIRKHGIRNSHLLSIAPTGTISLAFADNASNGIEPPFSWTYNRTKRMADGSKKQYAVEDYAYRLYRHMGADVEKLPDYFVTALSISAIDHMKMVAAVAPYVDAAISKTVNVPEDYPFEDFENLYIEAWKSGLKGITTYRPNNVTGAVLSVDAPKQEEVKPANTAAPAVALLEDDPLKKQLDKRPEGRLPAINDKVVYYTSEGKKSVYLSVSFAKAKGVINGEEVTIERPIEFFLPVGQKDEGHQWVVATMRMLSLAARGGYTAKALADLRQVSWDRGPVRCGSVAKTDGTQVPRYHDSEAAAIAYAIQQILHEVGFLDADGNQVPARVLAKKFGAMSKGAEVVEAVAEVKPLASMEPVQIGMAVQPGKKCKECGAQAVIKKDGCDFCTSCGAIGSCG